MHGNLTGVGGLTDYAQSFAYADANDPHNITTLVPGTGATPIVTTFDGQDRATRQVIGSEVIDIAYPTATTRTVSWHIQGTTPRVHSFQYQDTDLVRETNALGHELRQVFNAQRDLVRRELWQNGLSGPVLLQATDWTYDAQGRRLSESVTLDSGEVVTTTTTYDNGWMASEQTTSSASPQVFRTETTFHRDAQGVPVNVHQVKRRNDDGSFATTTYSYCSAADVANPSAGCPYERLLKQLDGPRTDVADLTSYAYYTTTDASGCGTPSGACHQKGALQRTTNALGQMSEVLAYDANARVARAQDANGVVTATTYHARGWPLTRTVFGADPASASDDATGTWNYDARGNLTSSTDPDGVTTHFVYDLRNRLIEVQDNAGGRLVYTLDNEGQRTKEEIFDASALVRTRSYTYDVQGRRTVERDAQNRATTTEYDAAGRPTRITDALGRATTQSYDDRDRLTQTVADVGGLNVVTSFSYDAAGNLRTVTDPKGLVTRYTYNALDQITQLDSPDTGITSYTSDAAGNRLTQTDARGITATYTYDPLNRLTSSVHGEGASAQTVTFAYDQADGATGCSASSPLGRLSTMTDPSGSTVYCHDRHGNPTRKTQTTNGVAHALATTYTLGDRISGLTYPSGVSANYTRDAQGRITGVNKNGTPLVTSATYRPFGPLSALTWAGGATETFVHDTNYWIDAINGTALNLDYSTDALGNISALAHADPAQARTFEYDRVSRLTAVKNGSATQLEGFSYDATGNRMSKSVQGASTQVYAYPTTSHRLTGIESIARSYDAAGSLTDRGDGWTFEYDARQRLQFIKQGGTLRQTNQYNGRGERVRKLSNTDTHFLFDDAGRQLTESNGAGQVQKDYLWIDDRPVGLIAHSGAYASETLAIHSDHLGTPRAITRPNDTAVWTWPLTGAAFGEGTPNVDPDGDSVALDFNLRFAGQYFDAESELHQNYFRDYEPGTGRYVESDPIGLELSISTYAYVDDRPLNSYDATGLGQAKVKYRKWALKDREHKRDKETTSGFAYPELTLAWCTRQRCCPNMFGMCPVESLCYENTFSPSNPAWQDVEDGKFAPPGFTCHCMHYSTARPREPELADPEDMLEAARRLKQRRARR